MSAMGFVTAGGRSSRMGSDKAWIDLRGRPMIQHVIDAISPVTTRVAIIASDPAYLRLGLPVIADQTPGVGPLEAIRTALSNSAEPFVVLAGCDLPFLTAELFNVLLEKAAGYHAAVPLSEADLPEPLSAVYSVEALNVVTDSITVGVRKVADFLDRIQTNLVSFSEIRHLRNSSLFFHNVNTPGDYDRAVAISDQFLRS